MTFLDKKENCLAEIWLMKSGLATLNMVLYSDPDSSGQREHNFMFEIDFRSYVKDIKKCAKCGGEEKKAGAKNCLKVHQRFFYKLN